MKPSDNNNIVGGFICRNQDILPMKYLDNLFQMSKREFRFRGYKFKVIQIKQNAFICKMRLV